MPFMNWKPEYNTGIPSVDSQHAYLVGLINELHEAMWREEANSILGELLTKLETYTRTHFQDEERVMRAHGCQSIHAHRREHGEMIRTVSELTRGFCAGRVMLGGEALLFLRDWLQNHILVVDRHMAAEIREIRAASLTTAVT